jgi:hypothetical protein
MDGLAAYPCTPSSACRKCTMTRMARPGGCAQSDYMLDPRSCARISPSAVRFAPHCVQRWPYRVPASASRSDIARSSSSRLRCAKDPVRRTLAHVLMLPKIHATQSMDWAYRVDRDFDFVSSHICAQRWVGLHAWFYGHRIVLKLRWHHVALSPSGGEGRRGLGCQSRIDRIRSNLTSKSTKFLPAGSRVIDLELQHVADPSRCHGRRR